jgi:DNA polymerase (family X)
MTDNVEIAKILHHYADLLDIQGENTFRVGSYRKAAQEVEGFSRPIADLIQEGKDLTTLPGIGTSMAEHLTEIVHTGTLSALQEIQKHVPGSLATIMRLQNVGPKKARQLYKELGVSSIAQLEKALKAGEVENLAGFGRTTVQKFQRAIKELSQHEQRLRLADVDQFVSPLLEHLHQAPGIKQLEVAGSYRRRKETVGDLDILVAGSHAEPIMKHFLGYPKVKRIENSGGTRGTVILTSGLKVDLRIVPQESYGAALHYFTGSKAHNVEIRKMGMEKSLRINEYGIFRVPQKKRSKVTSREDRNTEEQRVGGQQEADVFASVGLDWVPPELREHHGEIEAARHHRLPKLMTLNDIKGNLHMHSTWTDGKDSVEVMTKACRDLGYAYCAMTDHSQSTRIAGGLTAKELRQQWEEIRHIRDRLTGIQLLAGAEVDILEDGSLDYPDEILEQLDVIVASIHSKLNLTKKQMTQRIVKALSHPMVDILGHPTERQINEREPFAVDLEEVMHAAKEHNVALELNAQPKRLDLSDIYLRQAKEIGVKIAINSDAHSTDNLHFMRYGIDQARRGWLEPSDVINTMSWPRLQKWLNRRA